MAASTWKKVKTAIAPARVTAPCADVLVNGPTPVVDPAPEERRGEKKRAVLLAGLLEAASRGKGGKL